MLKAFRYRIYPTKRQETALNSTLALCCELYNAGLQERRDAYRTAGKNIGYNRQASQLSDIKQDRPEFKQIHSQVLQDALRRLDKAFVSFFRRVKQGETPGYPRFRASFRYDSFTYPQGGYSIVNGRLSLCKVGHIKIKLHRPVEGQVKTCAIRRTSTGKWFACLSAVVEAKPLPSSAEAVGIDAGLSVFAVLSNEDKIGSPHFFRREETELARVQRKLSASPKRSKERKKRRKIAARVHERIANKRHNFVHQESRKTVNEFGVICVEDLMISNMLKNHCFAKSIADAAWSMFFQCLAYKAEDAGRRFVKVDPRHTSQDCHKCGHRRTDLRLSDRIYRCANPKCLLIIDRDLNASLNILALGLQRLRLRPAEAVTFS